MLEQFATYLINFSLTPGLQKSTGDFASQLLNQTNPAIKESIGLQAMANIATIAGDPTSSQNHSSTASSFYSQWEAFAFDPSECDTLLSYQWRSSYGLRYNTFLNMLNLIPQSLYDM